MTNKLEFSRGDVIAKRYEVIDLLDESPLGFSYRVKNLKTGGFVRLNMLNPAVAGPESRDRVEASYRKVKEISHPGVIKLGEFDEYEGVLFYTAEDFEGSTLRELLQEYKIAGKQFAVKEAAHVVIQISEALTASHAAGFVLRALRPEYVLIHVRRTGPRRQNFVAQVKLLGVGFWDFVEAGTLAEDEFTRGEAQYLAPELKSFEPESTPKCDVYSAGVIFYEMLTGSAPVGTFQLPSHVRPGIPPHVNDVVELALANSPEDRYPTARDFVTDVQRTFAEVEHFEEKKKVNPVLLVLPWVVVPIVLIAAVGLLLWGINRKDPYEQAKAQDATLRATIIDKHVMPSPEETAAILAKHPPNMAYIPAGPFISGRLNQELTDARHTEPLAVEREVDAFLIDVFEYPNLKDGPPVYDISATEAERLCQEQGKRLCTELEWEKACKGPGNYIYSYGDTYDPDFCGEGVEDVYQSGAHEGCKSGWYVFDQSGNFREWTSTLPGGKTERRVVKGGMSTQPAKGTRCAFNTDEREGFKDKTMSFRCCRDADAPVWTPPAPEPAEGEEGEAAEGEVAPE